MQRIYRVTLKAIQKDFEENQTLPLLKQGYTEYLEPPKIVTESLLIHLVKAGRVIAMEYMGILDEELK